eukprot:TRINITY_DN998_c0_g1_i1.p1 TRINITY_DN998_c0_g1~~TRINITY_DN998_c0_g1_i1.p1  ORF type:complete len:582 (+),score=94.85 TRINITY_DN998_c0_g1_i1:347-2092(+)
MERERDFIGLKRAKVEIDKGDEEIRRLSTGSVLVQDMAKAVEASPCANSGLQLSLGPFSHTHEDSQKAPFAASSSRPCFQGFHLQNAEKSRSSSEDDKASVAMGEVGTNATAQWALWSKAISAQKLMPFKVPEDERSHKRKFDQIVSTGLQPFAVIDGFKFNQPNATALQKNLCLGHFTKEDEEPKNGAANVSAKPFINPVGTISTPVIDQHGFSVHSNKSGVAYSSENNTLSIPTTKDFLGISTPLKGQESTTASSANYQQDGAISFQAFASHGCLPSGSVQNRSEHSGNLGGNQLTIFYAGTVNVYDNIPPEKAQTVMLMANSFSKKKTGLTPAKNFTSSTQSATSISVKGQSRPATPAVSSVASNAITTSNLQQLSAHNKFKLSTQTSDQFHLGSQQRNSELLSLNKTEIPPNQCTVSNAEQEKSKGGALSFASTQNASENVYTSTLQGVPKFQSFFQPTQSEPLSSSVVVAQGGQGTGINLEQENAKLFQPSYKPTPVLPRAVPQARKASLARFLEKRKERVPQNLPCLVEKTVEEPCPQHGKNSSSALASEECKSSQHDKGSEVTDTKKVKAVELK